MSAYRWPQVNVWYCGHCGGNLGTDRNPAACPKCDIKHAFMIEKTEYLDIGAPNAKAGNRGGEEAAQGALPKGREERPDVEQLPSEG